MPEPDLDEDLPPTLDYQQPEPPPAWPPSRLEPLIGFLGGVFGVLAALFALLFWVVGVAMMYRALFHGHPSFRWQDRFQAAVVLVIALVSSAAAYRWLREAFAPPGRGRG